MKQKIASIKLIEFMCDNKSTLLVFKDDNFITYQLYGGHASSGIPEAITNLDRDGRLPDEIDEGQTIEDFVDVVASDLVVKRMCKAVDKVTVRKGA